MPANFPHDPCCFLWKQNSNQGYQRNFPNFKKHVLAVTRALYKSLLSQTIASDFEYVDQSMTFLIKEKSRPKEFIKKPQGVTDFSKMITGITWQECQVLAPPDWRHAPFLGQLTHLSNAQQLCTPQRTTPILFSFTYPSQYIC